MVQRNRTRGQGLVLDFDGTILDTEHSNYWAWSEVWDAHGHRLTVAEWQRNIGTDDVFDPVVELEHRLGHPLDPAALEQRRIRRDELLAPATTLPGIRDWLAEAEHLGVPVGIASSSPVSWVEGHLERLGLSGHLACMVCRSEQVPAKPDPTVYRLACAELGCDPARSVAVEDSPHGATAAALAGLYTVVVPNGLTTDLEVPAADVRVDALDQLTLARTLEAADRRSRPSIDRR